MGSIIEVFPPRAGAGRAARAWRRAPVPGGGTPKVRAARIVDCAAIRALQRASGAPTSTVRQLESQRHAFPEGQMVAVCDGEVVGAASSLVVRWDDYALDLTWDGITGGGYYTTHDRGGRTLYVAGVHVDLERRGAGIGRALFLAQRRIARQLNLRRIISAVRLATYQSFKDRMPPELYVKRVVWGDIDDAELRLHTSQGFQYCGVIRDYLPEDLASGGNAALMVWLNPLHSPAEPPANVEADRRRCA